MEKIKDIFCIEGLGHDSNSYLFDDVLVDTGTGMKKKYLYDKIKEAKYDINDISIIVNTHCHFDHVGGNYLFPNAKVFIHKNDADSIKSGDMSLTAGFLFEEPIKRTSVDIELKEGDKISNFEVLHTPGHTSGGICLWDGETLISGDTIFSNGGFGRLDIGGDSKDIAKSINRLSKLEVKFLLPGHGPWVNDGKRHIKLAKQMFKNIK